MKPKFPEYAGPHSDWNHRLAFAVETMREVSQQTDPQMMVSTYAKHMAEILPNDGFVSLSRRDLPTPKYRITRSTVWQRAGTAVNPFEKREQLPVFEGGLFGQLIYGEEPVIMNDLQIDPTDPAAEFCQGARSLQAIPLFDQGLSLNMVVRLSNSTSGFDHETLPEQVWMSNLFGRATHNLVLRSEVQKAYDSLDREMQVVADIQRSLLPRALPRIPTLELAVHYQTSQRAGGDYYDFFPLPGTHGEPANSPGGRWGLLIADVSGHGTPAAVLMAVCHSIAHTHNDPPAPPSALLNFLNCHLTARYTTNGSFITAFYGIYDPTTHTLVYSCAGHCPPRLRKLNSRDVTSLEGGRNLPLGIDADEQYEDATQQLDAGDVVLFYTDGITEGRQPGSVDLFGIERLDAALLGCRIDPTQMVQRILTSLDNFTNGSTPTDDRTLLAMRII